jgi:NADH-quinone oxidoreductase subunit L
MSDWELLLLAVLAAMTVVLPLGAFFAVGVLEVTRSGIPDRRLATIARAVFSATTAAGLGAAVLYALHGFEPVHWVYGHWFAIGDTGSGQGHYGFDLGILVDEVSLTFLILTAALSGTVGAFSLRYMSGEPGAIRFFRQMMLFAAAMSIVVLAESLDLLFIGWELVGISSALLIAFYRERSAPVRHGLTAFAIYRVCDVGLLAAIVVLHHWTGTGSLPGAAAAGLTPDRAAVVGALLVFASLGKSAQWPFSGWLPRAMEGPTPSSAIFYGALSVHAGAFLLLRTAPLWQGSWAVHGAIVTIGVVTAAVGTMVGRTQPDAKSALAWATVAQVGVVFVWIGFGWYTLALVHAAGHATVRTLEFLRAPSLLRDFQELEAKLGSTVPETGLHYEALLPVGVRSRLYVFAFERTGIEALVRRALEVGEHALRALDRIDREVLIGERHVGGDEPEILPELQGPGRSVASSSRGALPGPVGDAACNRTAEGIR